MSSPLSENGIIPIERLHDIFVMPQPDMDQRTGDPSDHLEPYLKIFDRIGTHFLAIPVIRQTIEMAKERGEDTPTDPLMFFYLHGVKRDEMEDPIIEQRFLQIGQGFNLVSASFAMNGDIREQAPTPALYKSLPQSKGDEYGMLATDAANHPIGIRMEGIKHLLKDAYATFPPRYSKLSGKDPLKQYKTVEQHIAGYMKTEIELLYRELGFGELNGKHVSAETQRQSDATCQSTSPR